MRRVVGHMFIAVFLAATAFAQQDLPKGEDIVAKANARQTTGSLRQTIQIKLIGKGGREKDRTARVLVKDDGVARKLLMYFQEPSRIRGTAILIYDYADPAQPDEQWVFLPILRKARRVDADERGGAIFGTDFTFEDIKDVARISVGDYDWTTTGTEKVDGQDCFVIQATPKSPELAKDLGYSKAIIRIDSAIYVPRKSEFFDAKGELLKTIDIRDIDQVDGVWTMHTYEATNHKTSHSSILTISDVDMKTPIDGDLLSVAAIEHGLPADLVGAR